MFNPFIGISIYSSMRIGVVVDNEFTNDIRVKNECTLLASDGHEVIVLALNLSSNPFEEILNDKTRVIRHTLNRKLKNILFALINTIDIYSLWWSDKIKKFIAKEKIEVLHVHDLYMSKAAHVAATKSGIGFNLDLHENYPAAVKGYKWMNKFPHKIIIRPDKWKTKEKKYLSYPDKIIVLSDQFRDKLINKYQFLLKDHIVVFPNVPDLDELSSYKIDPEILHKKEDEFILFYFGTISKRRGVFILLEALEKLIIDKPTIKLLLIGPVDKAEKEKFERRIDNPKTADHIIYYPWKDISLLPSFIKLSDVCLSPIEKNPQHESGIANKVFQYMLFERPVIVSDCKPQEELVTKEECGVVFKWDSSTDLASKIIELQSNQKLSSQMGFNGMQAIKKKYSTKYFAQNLLQLYL